MRNAAFAEGGGRAAPKPGDMVPLHDGTQGQLRANKWHVVGADRTAHIYDAKTGASRPAPDPQTALANHRLALNAKYGKQGYSSWASHSDVGRSLNVSATDIKQLQASARAKVQKAKR